LSFQSSLTKDVSAIFFVVLRAYQSISLKEVLASTY
jgi:hypothetical protein